jgi:hypothetical protein
VESLPQPELGGVEGCDENSGRFCWRNLYEPQAMQESGMNYVAIERGNLQ